MSRVGVRPGQVKNWIGELSALFLVEGSDTQENLRNDVLVQPGVARRRNRSILPCHPARRIRHTAVFFSEAGAGQPVHGSLDGLLLLRSDSRSAPELTGLIRINLTHN